MPNTELGHIRHTTNYKIMSKQEPQTQKVQDGWYVFFRGLGIIGIVITIGAIIFCIIAFNDNDEQARSTSIMLTIAGLVITIQSFFISFLINVFTDIRWFLGEIVKKQKETKL
jgi:heme/copper-type cytochrome/quinol oxidase subunit 2